ncbi:hypothetical protein RAB80_018353 [Fusarium oxysporum f. sp. vasinfectum]|nr:hypothetical protein RAB80_018231 [Fusarium oxysporum f. sp. vasinfectum]KAK2666253.1 hypothetical protein RAB80_018353 [Fusarium oxysporum f. sp. vasinfectum]KAK2922337.1 hypothetical protein FoTM2_017693 [Fusarium oxysporum f. sp. vasinfectum]
MNVGYVDRELSLNARAQAEPPSGNLNPNGGHDPSQNGGNLNPSDGHDPSQNTGDNRNQNGGSSFSQNGGSLNPNDGHDPSQNGGNLNPSDGHDPSQVLVSPNQNGGHGPSQNGGNLNPSDGHDPSQNTGDNPNENGGFSFSQNGGSLNPNDGHDPSQNTGNNPNENGGFSFSQNGGSLNPNDGHDPSQNTGNNPNENSGFFLSNLLERNKRPRSGALPSVEVDPLVDHPSAPSHEIDELQQTLPGRHKCPDNMETVAWTRVGGGSRPYYINRFDSKGKNSIYRISSVHSPSFTTNSIRPLSQLMKIINTHSYTFDSISDILGVATYGEEDKPDDFLNSLDPTSDEYDMDTCWIHVQWKSGGTAFVNRDWWRRMKPKKDLPKDDKKRKYFKGLDEFNRPKENPHGPADRALWKWAVARETLYFKDKHGTTFTYDRAFSPINDNIPGGQQLSAAYQSILGGAKKSASPTPLVYPQPPQYQQPQGLLPPQGSLPPQSQPPQPPQPPQYQQTQGSLPPHTQQPQPWQYQQPPPGQYQQPPPWQYQQLPPWQYQQLPPWQYQQPPPGQYQQSQQWQLPAHSNNNQDMIAILNQLGERLQMLEMKTRT